MLLIVWIFWLSNWCTNRGRLLHSYWCWEIKQILVIGKKVQTAETSSAFLCFKGREGRFLPEMLGELWHQTMACFGNWHFSWWWLKSVIWITSLFSSFLPVSTSMQMPWVPLGTWVPQLQIAYCKQGMRDSGIWHPDIEAVAKGLTLCLNIKSGHWHQQRFLFSLSCEVIHIKICTCLQLYTCKIMSTENMKKMHKMECDKKI